METRRGAVDCDRNQEQRDKGRIRCSWQVQRQLAAAVTDTSVGSGAVNDHR